MGENFFVEKLVVKTTDPPQRTLVDGIYGAQLSIKQVEDEDGNYVDDPNYTLELSALTNVNGTRVKPFSRILLRNLINSFL